MCGVLPRKFANDYKRSVFHYIRYKCSWCKESIVCALNTLKLYCVTSTYSSLKYSYVQNANVQTRKKCMLDNQFTILSPPDLFLLLFCLLVFFLKSNDLLFALSYHKCLWHKSRSFNIHLNFLSLTLNWL